MTAGSDLTTVIAPTGGAAVPKLLADVAAAGDALSEAGLMDIEKRMDLLAKAEKLTHALKTPREIMIQDTWSQPANVAAISFGVSTGLWTTMASNGDETQRVPDLAKQIGVEEELLRRMMRHVAASGYLDLTADDEYTPNSFSKSLALPVMSSGYYTCPPISNPSFLAHEEWFKKNNHRCPTDRLDTPYQIGHNTKLNWFEYLQANPPHGENFNNIMFGYLLGRPAWTDIYPAQERLINGFDKNETDGVLFVDVAGGIGHYTAQFLSKFPDAPGRLVVQDLPGVIEAIQDLHPRIERNAYDMFTENPIKGARTYFTHFVLHDWPDEDAIKIASRVKEAMRPGYSKFLIHEHVIPPTGQNHEQTGLDILMMTNFAGKERSAAQWSDLLEAKVGLKIVDIHRGINGIESVVECERPE